MTNAEHSDSFKERQREIARVASHLFARQGYHATTISQISEAAGLGRGGLYHYIGSKSELLFQVHEHCIDPLLTGARRILDEPLTPPEALKRLGSTLMRNIANQLDAVTVVLHEWSALAQDPRAPTIRAKRKEFEWVVEQILERGVREGYFEIGNPHLTVLGFLSMFNYTYSWFRPDGANTPEEIAEVFCQTFLQGISVKVPLHSLE